MNGNTTHTHTLINAHTHGLKFAQICAKKSERFAWQTK